MAQCRFVGEQGKRQRPKLKLFSQDSFRIYPRENQDFFKILTFAAISLVISSISCLLTI